MGDNLSITDIALKNWDLSIIGVAQGFFEVIVIALVQKGLLWPSLNAFWIVANATHETIPFLKFYQAKCFLVTEIIY